jgi:hypothetical protein
MNHVEAQDWLDRYVDAWRSNDPEKIGALFSENVSYRYYPFGKSIEGREAVVRSWLANPDEPGSWEAHYTPFSVQDNKVVAVGTSRYFAHGEEPQHVYHNCFLIAFDDAGACSSYTEFFVEEPKV